MSLASNKYITKSLQLKVYNKHLGIYNYVLHDDNIELIFNNNIYNNNGNFLKAGHTRS